ncbi:isoprenylcysteine alpha-carbonyl methylesterase ICME-like isoform X2 [Nicotiana tomentosiformis]|uniref:isoprenylcysteine alpha-carbonyl methylesterase ICME-like isoform X2 n=1 Tax=Nicotiana tomentosiformis TaxID=4098 RepID=UPI00051BB74A|nr:isoprenylcysteine alpha-carbonyl methylesterase ICME-like isoform X3 [Nicotiana tomentosiformis]
MQYCNQRVFFLFLTPLHPHQQLSQQVPLLLTQCYSHLRRICPPQCFLILLHLMMILKLRSCPLFLLSCCGISEIFLKELLVIWLRMFLKEYLLFVTTYIAKYGGDPSRYNLFNLVDHFHSRGLYRSMFLSIMEGDQGLGQYSPQVMVQDPNIRNDVSLLPPTILFHGTADYSIPCDSRIRC